MMQLSLAPGSGGWAAKELTEKGLKTICLNGDKTLSM